MRLGVIGCGPWGNVYSDTLTGMGVPHWQAGRDWRDKPKPDAAIVACAAEHHFRTAKQLIAAGVPVLIEKPVCMTSQDADKLMKLAQFKGGIVFTGHTRLYSARWRRLKFVAQQEGVKSVYAVAGGKCRLDPLWDWGPHLVALAIDLGIDPMAAHILTSEYEQPLKVIVNGTLTYTDEPEEPQPLVTLLGDFLFAIEQKKPDVRGLELGVAVLRTLELMRRRFDGMAMATEYIAEAEA